MSDVPARAKGRSCRDCNGTNLEFLGVENVYSPAAPAGPPIEQEIRMKCRRCGRVNGYTTDVPDEK